MPKAMHRVVSLDGLSSAFVLDQNNAKDMEDALKWVADRLQRDASGVLRWNTVFADKK